MRRWRAALAALALSALLSGCFTDTRTETSDDTTEGAPPVLEELVYDGCREILGVWDMDYEDVVDYLPPGFEPDSSILPPQDSIGRNASMELLAINCTDPTDTNLLIPWLTVTPPHQHVHPEADVYRLVLPCIGDAPIVEVLETWGAPCTDGDTDFTAGTGAPVGDTWAFDAQTPGFTIGLEGIGAATEELSDEPVFRQFHVTDRTVCAISHLELEDHIHWRGHGFTVEAKGDVPFPIPDGPGAGFLAMPDFHMKMAPMPMQDEVTSEACPAMPDPDANTRGPR